MDKIRMLIAGEIVLSPEPGKTLKKWREIFQITQSELAKHLGISPSTISDYESNRRKSPGVKVIKRFVDAMFEIDAKRGSPIARNLSEEKEEQFFERRDFTQPIKVDEFVKLIDGKYVSKVEGVENDNIYGYTILDSLKIILDMPYEEFPKLYGGIPERAFIFLGVSTGRSPLVVIRVAPTKPKIVVLHNLNKVDPLAIKISQRIKIPIVTTNLDIDEIKKRLRI